METSDRWGPTRAIHMWNPSIVEWSRVTVVGSTMAIQMRNLSMGVRGAE